MRNPRPFLRRMLCILGCLGILFPFVSAFAQSASPTLFLRPHCLPAFAESSAGKQEDRTLCPEFPAQDPSTLVTEPLKVGETLDLDLVLRNPTKEAMSKIRVWLSYDSDALEGKTIAIAKEFPTVVPGQSDFAPVSGYAKIAASAQPGKEPKEAILPLARISFTVKSGATAASSPLSFYDQKPNIEGHTYVVTATAPDNNLVTAPLGTLLVRFAAAASAMRSSIPSTSSVSSVPSPSISTPPDATSTSFGLIQVQNVRVSTEDSALFVTWDSLSHPRMQGYNVYYGTLAGRYLQRHSVSLAARGAVIRDLPAGRTYYVSVRGVGEDNRETTFSPEASVEIGNPSTASPAIIGSLDLVGETAPGMVAPENPVDSLGEPSSGSPLSGSIMQNVPGASGTHSGIALLVLGSAAIGVFFAFRRQLFAHPTGPLAGRASRKPL